MGKLAESLAVVPASKRCRVAEIVEHLDAEDRQAFADACLKVRAVAPRDRSSGYPFTEMWLIRALRTQGFTLSKESMSRHVKGECGCEFA
jgi:hypothetical protein